MATLGGKRLARTMQTLSTCIAELQTENDALRAFLVRITNYATVQRLRSHSEKDWGLPFEEALEMAYENVISEAEAALRWKPAKSNGHVTGRDPVEPSSGDAL